MAKKINDYKLLRELGQGGFGITYLAEKDKRQFVIKKIIKKINKNEIRALKTIQQAGCQPDVLCYVEDFEKDNTQYIVTELFPNSTDLHNYLWVYTKYLDNQDKLKIMLNITNALSRVHNLGIAHLDLKPDNILINTISMNVQIIDFGLSCSKEYLKKCSIGGTIDYYPPEMLENAIAGKRQFETIDQYKNGDIFSLGAIFYSIIRGEAPIDKYDDTRFELGNSYKTMMPLLLNYYRTKGFYLNTKIPIEKLISEMLSLNPYKRPSLEKIIESLLGFIKEPISTREKPSKKAVSKPTSKPNKKLISKEMHSKTEISQKKKTVDKTKKCPDGQELNPKTNRCIKKCEEGYERTLKSNRCVKKCKPGFKRNIETGRCVKGEQ